MAIPEILSTFLVIFLVAGAKFQVCSASRYVSAPVSVSPSPLSGPIPRFPLPSAPEFQIPSLPPFPSTSPPSMPLVPGFPPSVPIFPGSLSSPSLSVIPGFPAPIVPIFPGSPSSPSTPLVPGFPVPSMPAIPASPSSPSSPVIPDLPVPIMPTFPGSPISPATPLLPGFPPSMPAIPGSPSSPSSPVIPGFPVPMVPTYPGSPSSPSTPLVPGFPVPSVPSIPGLPSSPYSPIIPGFPVTAPTFPGSPSSPSLPVIPGFLVPSMPPFPSTSPPSPPFIPIFPVPSLPPGTVPPYMPLIPPSISPSMPPVPASCPPSVPSAPYSSPPSPSMPSIPVSSPPIMPLVPAPVPYPSMPVPAPGPTPTPSGIKGAYWLSWLAESAPSSSIPTEYFTHIFYAFAVPDNTSFQLLVSQTDEQSMINFTATIHSQSHATKTMLSIGGDTGSPVLPSMTSCHDNRASFIKSTIDVARKCGFDGLDLDWEFPTKSENMHNLALLLKEWRHAISIESLTSSRPPLILSAALSFSPDPLLSGTFYPREALKNYLDFLNPMCYNYKGSWDTSVTGAPALLYDKSSNISTSYGISAWKQNGVPSTKLVMGIPLFGKTWKLKDPNDHRIGAPAVGVGPGTQGEMSYDNIVTFNSENNATIVYNNETVSTYSYVGTNWIGYDDINSITKKIKYAKTQGIGGYFFWALGYDSNWTLSRAASMAWDDEI
ncbi:uncharacterized protein LOC107779277 [Nicotiana tabacum]|uniref:Uncharacterized protein LOC107779277 n=1 Tax=Nicotiana tabacum TaxID=4097 RepID=A0A1S3YSG2_TOBAC